MNDRIDVYCQKDAIKADIGTKTAFIIANEREKSDGSIGRYYTIFSDFNVFLENRNQYKHCHEQLIDHIAAPPDLAGRLVFDFDIKSENIPNNFKKQIETTIFEVINCYMQDVDTNKLKFIWSSSMNPAKFSKHLTVKHMYFDNWIELSKVFYQLFCLIWDEKYVWINSDKLIDFQIVRKGGSLRMVGSSKIGGKKLLLDNSDHTLVESLIRIYQPKHRMKEQCVTKKNFLEMVFTDILKPHVKTVQIVRNHYSGELDSPNFNKNVYRAAFKLCEEIHSDTFVKGKISGAYMSLLRNKPSRCILSEKYHESDNAYLYIREDGPMYVIYFGCYRKCNSQKKTIRIGSVTMSNYIHFVDEHFS